MFPGWTEAEDILIKHEDFDIYDEDSKFKLHLYNKSYGGDYDPHEESWTRTVLYWLNIVSSRSFERIRIYDGSSWHNLKDISNNHELWVIRRDLKSYYQNKGFTITIMKAILTDKYKDFVTAKLILENEVQAREIWKQAIVDFNNKIKEIIPFVKANPWKYLNPGSQNFGKVSPINTHPSLWYGTTYRSTVAGLNDEIRVHITFSLRSHGIPNELIRIINMYRLKGLAIDGRNNLFRGDF